MAIEVQNKPPSVNLDYKIAIIGAFPSKDDEVMRSPYSGYIGGILEQALKGSNTLKSACFLGNLAITRPDNNFAHSANSWQSQDGRERLTEELARFNPNVVLLLGQAPLKAAGITHSLEDYRGSLFKCVETLSPFYGRKCVATYAPDEVQRVYKYMPLFKFDVTRARNQADSPELVLPQRNIELYLTNQEICDRLYSWPLGLPGAFDIEGGIIGTKHNGITCMSIASSPYNAFIIDWRNMREEGKREVAIAVQWWLKNPDIPKVAQNALYEMTSIGYQHHMAIGNMHWDTMLSGWELYPELNKGLATQTSIYTLEPFYKFERKIHDTDTHNTYCCKDSLVTYEIYEKHKKLLSTRDEARQHFEFNMSLLPAVSYMELRGMRFDVEGSRAAAREIRSEISVLQSRIDVLNGEPLNINSPKQMQNCLYRRMGLEPQYKVERGKKTNKLTCDAVALLKLLTRHNSDIVYNILKTRALEGFEEQLLAPVDTDGRIRTTYNVVGTETGRLAGYGSNTGSGFNLQTVTKKARRYYIADPGMYMFQVDLSGADGWTVAAHSERLNDPFMIEDYYAGVKPARVIAAMYQRGNDKSIARRDPDSMKAIIASVEIPEWLYAACKAIQHGSSYGMGLNTMSNNILLRSWKDDGEPVYVAPKACGVLQDLFFARYKGVVHYQGWIKLELQNKGKLPCASGHVRNFFGRLTDNATLGSAYAHEPQANTTYATNLALRNLVYDPENRDERGRYIIEPLHQVHDAVIGQFPKDRLEWATAKLKTYFHNPMTIAGKTLVIPYEGEYGSYWGDNSGGSLSYK